MRAGFDRLTVGQSTFAVLHGFSAIRCASCGPDARVQRTSGQRVAINASSAADSNFSSVLEIQIENSTV